MYTCLGPWPRLTSADQSQVNNKPLKKIEMISSLNVNLVSLAWMGKPCNFSLLTQEGSMVYVIPGLLSHGPPAARQIWRGFLLQLSWRFHFHSWHLGILVVLVWNFKSPVVVGL